MSLEPLTGIERLVASDGTLTPAGQRIFQAIYDEIEAPGTSAGLPAGGTFGQVLTKQSAIDGDADWEDIILDGGGA